MAKPDPPKPGLSSHIPMTPSELPLQRIVEVVDLPERPIDLETYVDWIAPLSEERPKRKPRAAEFLCAAEWAWSPYHERLDHYYLAKSRSNWLIWTHWFDENWGKWEWTLYAYATKRRLHSDPYPVAVWMLVDAWRAEAKMNDLDSFHWLTSVGLLHVPIMRAISRAVWDKAFEVEDDDSA